MRQLFSMAIWSGTAGVGKQQKPGRHPSRQICGNVVLLLCTTAAIAAESKQFHIAPKPLAEALRDFGVQGGEQIFFFGEQIASERSPGVSGVMDPERALSALLNGTTLTFRRSGNGFVIVPVSAQPQNAIHVPPQLEEVIITAQRRVEQANKSALSVRVIKGETLSRTGATNTNSLLESVPGMSMTNQSPYHYLSLRGLGSGGGTQWNDGAMAFNVGGVHLARQYATNGALYDLERIEVLKGPQGTLYGRNATVGALNIVPNRPETGRFKGAASVTAGNYAATQTAAMINLPVGERLAVRLATSSNYHDGYLTNGYDDENSKAGRLSFLYAPQESASILLWADRLTIASRGPSYVFRYATPDREFQMPENPWFAFAPSGCADVATCPTFGDSAVEGGGAPILPPFDSYSVVGPDGHVDLEQTIIAAELNWKTSAATLTFLPAYVRTETDFVFYPPGLLQENTSNISQRSAEARLASDSHSALKWIIGGLYFSEHIDARQFTLQTSGWQIPYTPNLLAKSTAIFGELTYPLSARWRLTGGARYTRDAKSQDGYFLVTGTFQTTDRSATNYCPIEIPDVVYLTSPSTFQGLYYPYGYCRMPNTGNVRFSDVSWKAGVEADVTENWLMYGNARTGYRAGGLAPGTGNTYRPEKLTAYEIGSKTRFWDARAQANLELFYWDYRDQQINLLHAIQPAGQTSWPVSVPGYIQGAELDLDILPTRTSRLALDLLYVVGKYDLYPVAISSSGTVGGLTNYPRTNLPNWNGSVNYQHRYDFTQDVQLLLGAGVHFESGTNLRPVPAGNQVPADYRPAFQTLNVDATLKSTDDQWAVTAYAKNLTNEAVINVGTGGAAIPGVFYRPPTNPLEARGFSIAPPRTYGLRLTVNL